MSHFQGVYYRDASGHEPVREFIDALDEDSQAAIDNQIARLNLLSDEMPHLPFPHSSKVDGELRELRCHYGRRLFRILYGRSDRLVILLAYRHVRPEGTRRSALSRGPERVVSKTAKVRAAGCRKRDDMAEDRSSIGTNVEAHIEIKRSRSARYREEHERLRPFEELARMVIVRRARLGLSQQDLAERMGTTASVISRIESGQHRTSTETLRRLGEALDGHAVVGFEFATSGEPDRELVTL